ARGETSEIRRDGWTYQRSVVTSQFVTATLVTSGASSQTVPRTASGRYGNPVQLHGHRDRAVVAQQCEDLGDAVASEHTLGASEDLVRSTTGLHRDLRQVVDGALALVVQHGIAPGANRVEYALRKPELDTGPHVHGPDVLALPVIGDDADHQLDLPLRERA